MGRKEHLVGQGGPARVLGLGRLGSGQMVTGTLGPLESVRCSEVGSQSIDDLTGSPIRPLGLVTVGRAVTVAFWTNPAESATPTDWDQVFRPVYN